MTPRSTRLDRMIERQLSAAETRAYLEAPISTAEREAVLTLVRWFTRRYPSGAERLAYVRRAYRRWQKGVQ